MFIWKSSRDAVRVLPVARIISLQSFNHDGIVSVRLGLTEPWPKQNVRCSYRVLRTIMRTIVTHGKYISIIANFTMAQTKNQVQLQSIAYNNAHDSNSR